MSVIESRGADQDCSHFSSMFSAFCHYLLPEKLKHSTKAGKITMALSPDLRSIRLPLPRTTLVEDYQLPVEGAASNAAALGSCPAHAELCPPANLSSHHEKTFPVCRGQKFIQFLLASGLLYKAKTALKSTDPSQQFFISREITKSGLTRYNTMLLPACSQDTRAVPAGRRWDARTAFPQ